MDDARAHSSSRTTTPVYYITGTIHSPESGAPTALIELAYRLAVDESPYVRNIRDHVITLITPIVEVDGRDREVDLVRWHLAHPGQTYPPLIYWGHYVAHDNNRDAMGMTLKLTQNVLNTYVDWHAQVLHDLHESVPFLYDNTVGDGPYNAWVDPLLTNEWQMLGLEQRAGDDALRDAWRVHARLLRHLVAGLPHVHGGHAQRDQPPVRDVRQRRHAGDAGAHAHPRTRRRGPGTVRTRRCRACNGRCATTTTTRRRDSSSRSRTSRTIGTSSSRISTQKSKRSMLKARTEGPAAYVLPANDPRLGAQAELLRVLQRQHVEISRATSAVHRDQSRRGAAARGQRREARRPHGTTALPRRRCTRTFPAGSYVVRMDQPYSRIADALLDYQYWSPDDPQKTPYDDTGWSFPEGFAVDAVRVTDPRCSMCP